MRFRIESGRNVARYLVALAAVAVAGCLTAVTWPLCASTPEAFFFAAVMIAAWGGGAAPSLLATTLSIAVVAYFFRPPYHTLTTAPEAASAMIVFAIVSLFMGVCSAAKMAVEAREKTTRRRFEGIATSIADAVATIDAQGRTTFLNAAAERLSGWSLAEAVGRPIVDVFPLEPPAARDSLLELPQAGAPRRFDGAVMIDRQGTARRIQGSAAPIADDRGVVIGAVLSCRDVGERLEMQSALSRVEGLNRKLLDSSLDCAKFLALDGRILSMNEPGCRQMDVDDFEDVRNSLWSDFWPETSRPRVREAVARAASGFPDSFQAACATMKGDLKEWEVHLSPILGVDGAPERIYCISRDVTDSRRAEARLHSSEVRYQQLFDSIDEGFCVIEMIFNDSGHPVDYLFLEANPAFSVHTKLDDVVGKTMRQLVPDHEEHWFATYGEVAVTGKPVRCVNAADKLGGAWFDLYAFPLEGRKVAILFTNITASRQAQQERERLLIDLKHERAKLERVVQNAPAFICILRGPDHVFDMTNRRYDEMVGERDLIGKPAREAFPELEGQGFFELLDQVYRTGQTFVGNEVPIQLRRPDTGVLETHSLNFVYQATREADGEVSGIFVHGVDVTDMINARDAVRDSEARFRQLADAMPQAVWAARADGVIDYFNRKWREYGDYPEGVLGDDRWVRLIHPEDLERVRNSWLESVRTGRPFEVEYRLLRAADAGYRWHLGRALPIEDSRGRIIRWFGTNTDVDDVKQLSEALKQTDRRKDEFLATLAHELRNPLAPIRNGLQILGLNPGAEAIKTTVEMMSRQVSHMVHLIDDLMDVARVSSGKITLRRQRLELQAVAAGAVESCRQIIDHAQHTLSTSFDPQPIPLDADPTRLTQVIANLLNNAAKYTERGGRIDLTVRREGDQAVVSVRDTGVGISPEMLPRVFEMFTQVDDSLDRAQGGLGIGLTIVKRLIEMHGGRIEVRSAGAGCGSEFIAHLPIADAALEATPDDAPQADDRQERTGRIRVLVVDDSRDSANSLARLLALDGHDVHTAYDGVQAVAEAAAFPPDLILLDLGLPDKNGFEVAMELRASADFRDTMIVALTGWGQPEDRRRSCEAGIDHHLVKPVEIDALFKIIDAVAREAGARRSQILSARND